MFKTLKLGTHTYDFAFAFINLRSSQVEGFIGNFQSLRTIADPLG